MQSGLRPQCSYEYFLGIWVYTLLLIGRLLSSWIAMLSCNVRKFSKRLSGKTQSENFDKNFQDSKEADSAYHALAELSRQNSVLSNCRMNTWNPAQMFCENMQKWLNWLMSFHPCTHQFTKIFQRKADTKFLCGL